MKTTIKVQRTNGLKTLTLSDMTDGKILALQNALQAYGSTLASEIEASIGLAATSKPAS